MARLTAKTGTSRTGEFAANRGRSAPYSFLTPRIDEEKATEAREEMTRKKIIYGHSVPYRNMCRYNSGVSYLCSARAHCAVFLPPPAARRLRLLLACRARNQVLLRPEWVQPVWLTLTFRLRPLPLHAGQQQGVWLDHLAARVH